MQKQQELSLVVYDTKNLRMRAQLGLDGKPIYYTPSNKVTHRYCASLQNVHPRCLWVPRMLQVPCLKLE